MCMKWSLLFLFVCFFSGAVLHSQTALTGKVSDESGKGLIGATVKVLKGTEFFRGAVADINGEYCIELEPGIYNVEFSYTGYSKAIVNKIIVEQDKVSVLNKSLQTYSIFQCGCHCYRPPIISADPEYNNFNTFTSEQLRRMVR
jgi:hypothetical protein